MLQLKLAEEIGFSVPDTIYSNSAKEIMEFQKRHGCCIYKPHDGWSFSGNKKHAVFIVGYTREAYSRNRPKNMCELAGMFSNRTYRNCLSPNYCCCGRKVFATKIDSQANKRAKTDWRKEDFKKLHHEEHLSVHQLRKSAFDSPEK